jgi:hypothetical protein
MLFAPVLAPFNVNVVTPVVGPGVIPPPNVSVAVLLVAPLVNV